MRPLLLVFVFTFSYLFCNAQDTLSTRQDTLVQSLNDSIPKSVFDTTTGTIDSPLTAISVQQIIDSNRFLRNNKNAVSYFAKLRAYHSEDALFYLFVGYILFFGIVRAVFSRYFQTMLRVFFNTSLRQNQLTDQLLQARLPSLLFNIFFSIVAGLYIYLLLGYYGEVDVFTDWNVLALSSIAIASVYLGKYLVLKFVGWLSGFSTEADLYMFIVFLVNKIIAIIILPVSMVIAFADRNVAAVFVTVSLMLLAVLLILRYLRSYSLLQNKLRLTRPHFILFVLAVEVVPLLLLFKLSGKLLTQYL